MAELLYRLGALAAKRAWATIVAWVSIAIVATVAFVLGFGGLATSFDIPGTASGKVVEELQEKLPDFSGASGMVVFETTDGSPFTDEQKEQISDLADGATDLPDVAKVVDPFETEADRADQQQQLADGKEQLEAGQAQLDAGQEQLDASRAQAEAFGMPTDQLDAAQAQLDEQQAELDANAAKLATGEELLELADGIQLVSDDGSTALVSISYSETRLELPPESKEATIEYFEETPIEGVEVSFSTDISQGVPQIFGVGEAIGLLIAAIVLFVMLGSVIAAAIPVVTAIFGLAVASLATLSSSGLVTMASVTPVLGVMLGLAVGIDYSLFIINRHRKQLLEGAEVKESVALANGTAGTAVVFAGATVIVALVALNVTGIPFLGLMGTAGAIAVFTAVLVATSLTPAILSLLGVRILSRKARARIGEAHHEDAGAKPMSTVRAVLTVLATTAVLLIVALPALSMRVGLPDGGSEPAGSLPYQAFTATEAAFGEGATGPLLVTADLPSGLSDDEVLQAQLDVATALSELDDVVAVAPIAVSDDNELAAFQVVPAEGPNSESTDALVRELRAMPPVNGDIAIGVAGQAAINIDISESIADVLPLYLLVVVGLSLIIMILVFRSLLVPLVATGGFILSLFATYGALTAVFQFGWLGGVFGIHNPGPILSFLPVILVGILFGLAMDYQLFLSTGMREAFVHGAPARLAVSKGFRAGRSVVIAAGLIMVAVFGGFIFSESVIIRALGFGLAVGVLVDAFVVRLLFMPAMMHLLGKSAWWIPRWLDRVMPNVDVEGAALERKHHA